MPYLIDGHNVIAQTPGLSLDDPQDEIKLVGLVKRFCARERKRATLVFDRGLPGGPSPLSNRDVTVVFASDRHTTADDLLLNRLHAEPNPRGLIMVTSDQSLANAARRRQVAVVSASEFGRRLARLARGVEPGSEKTPRLSPEEIAEWEEVFKRRGKKSGK